MVRRGNDILSALFDGRDFAIGIAPAHFNKIGRQQLLVPAELWLSAVAEYCLPQSPRSELVDKLEILCTPSVRSHAGHVELKDAFGLVPRRETMQRLCHRLDAEFLSVFSWGRGEWKVHLHEIVLDIWENEQGLNATQQLFALACVRTCL